MGQDIGKAIKTKSPHIRERIFDPLHFALCADEPGVLMELSNWTGILF